MIERVFSFTWTLQGKDMRTELDNFQGIKDDDSKYRYKKRRAKISPCPFPKLKGLTVSNFYTSVLMTAFPCVIRSYWTTLTFSYRAQS